MLEKYAEENAGERRLYLNKSRILEKMIAAEYLQSSDVLYIYLENGTVIRLGRNESGQMDIDIWIPILNPS